MISEGLISEKTPIKISKNDNNKYLKTKANSNLKLNNSY